MKLYNSVGPNPQSVRTFAAEKGLSLELAPVDILAGENREAGFKAVNPLGQTPALVMENGQVLTEVIAISEYLEELHPAPALIGATAAERAEMRMWTRRIDLGVVDPLTAGFRATVGRPMFAPRMALLSEAAGAELLGLMHGNLRQLDGMCAGRTWVAGERFGLADILLGVFLRFGNSVGMPPPEGLGWIPGFLQRCEARPSFGA